MTQEEYYSKLATASNTVNILSGSNTDHMTITAFMDWNEKYDHLEALEFRAEQLEAEYK